MPDVTITIDTSAIEPDLQRISDAFQHGKLDQPQTLALMDVLRNGTFLHDGTDGYRYQVRWKTAAEQVIREVLGTGDDGRDAAG